MTNQCRKGWKMMSVDTLKGKEAVDPVGTGKFRTGPYKSVKDPSQFMLVR